jgi:hypothetical protein
MCQRDSDRPLGSCTQSSFDLVGIRPLHRKRRSGSGPDRGCSAGQKRCCTFTCFIWDKRVVEREWRKSLPSLQGTSLRALANLPLAALWLAAMDNAVLLSCRKARAAQRERTKRHAASQRAHPAQKSETERKASVAGPCDVMSIGWNCALETNRPVGGTQQRDLDRRNRVSGMSLSPDPPRGIATALCPVAWS